jgi:hypothetical protein
MRKITAISANTTPERYVTNTHNRPDGTIAVELSDDKNKAHDFVTAKNANNIIKNIFNPWERKFTVKPIEVVQPKPIFGFAEQLN